MQPAQKKLFAVGAFAVLAFLWARRHAKTPDPAPLAMRVEKIVPGKKRPKVKLGILRTAAEIQSLKLTGKERSANFLPLSYGHDAAGHTTLAVTIKNKYTCHPGEYETLTRVVGGSGSVLVSLEPIGKSSAHGRDSTTQKVTLRQIVAGVTVDLRVDTDHPGIYGLFICTDDDNAGFCGRKQPANFNAIMAGRIAKRDHNALFYFQFAAIKADYPMVFAGLASDVTVARDNLDEQKFASSRLDEDTKRVKLLMREMKSAPPTTIVSGTNASVALALTALDSSKCGAKARP